IFSGACVASTVIRIGWAGADAAGWADLRWPKPAIELTKRAHTAVRWNKVNIMVSPERMIQLKESRHWGARAERAGCEHRSRPLSDYQRSSARIYPQMLQRL